MIGSKVKLLQRTVENGSVRPDQKYFSQTLKLLNFFNTISEVRHHVMIICKHFRTFSSEKALKVPLFTDLLIVKKI